MPFFAKNAPAYFGDDGIKAQTQPDCKRRKGGFFGWLGDFVGFPTTPCYDEPKAVPSDPGEKCPPCDTDLRSND